MPTFKDLFYFVLKHKRGKVFRGMLPLQIAAHLKLGLDTGCLWFKEVNGQITGMILFEVDREKKMGFIKENLALTKSNLIEFAKRAIRDYPGYTLHWYKNGTHKVWNTSKFYRKLGVI